MMSRPDEMTCPWCRDGDHFRCTARPPCLCTDPFHAPLPDAGTQTYEEWAAYWAGDPLSPWEP